MTPRFSTDTAPLLLLLLFPLSGCQQEVECGVGTVLSQGECIPLQAANCQGDGVRFVDGRCEPDFTAVCGPGTVLSDDGSECLPEPTSVGDTGTFDSGRDGGAADTRADAGDGTGVTDGGRDGADAVDTRSGQDTSALDTDAHTEPDITVAPPTCADTLSPGSRICVRGQVLNFIDLTPAPADAVPALEVQIKHLASAQGNPAVDPLGQALVGPGGLFLIPEMNIPGPGLANTLLLIAGESGGTAPEGPGTVWQRTLGGLITIPDESSQTEFEVPLFTIPRASVADWNTRLELGAGSLERSGFVLLRVITPDQTPIQGATVAYADPGTEQIEYFQDIAMTRFSPRDRTTGPSGSVLVTGVDGGNCTATAPGFLLAGPANCTASPGRLTVGVLVMIPD